MDAVLLVVDLEGVAGVTDLRDLIAGTPGFARARRLLTAEVAAAVRGLRSRGVRRVRVSDSHRAGASEPTVLAGDLPGVDIFWEDDPYAPHLWDGIDAVACLGMHAAARTAGFAAHTVSLHCAWRAGGRDLSETDIVLGLAAERGVPALFVAGGPDIERLAATAAPFRPAPLPREIDLLFKSHWQAEAGARAGGERTGTHSVRIAGDSFGDAYRLALRAVHASDLQLALAVQSDADAIGLLRRPFPLGRPPSYRPEGERALASFLAATAGDRSWERADRALVLHMLEGHAPELFRALNLAAVLDDAMARLAAVPADFPPGLQAVEAMARVDALYLAPRPHDGAALAACIRELLPREPLFAWLLDQMAVQLGATPAIVLPERALRANLYHATHRFFLATGFLRRPLPPSGWESLTEELCLAVPFVIGELRVDVAAEIAVCLQLAGEVETGEHHRLLALLGEHQLPDGRVVDPSSEGRADADETDRLRAHATGAALLAFAGVSRNKA